MPLLVVFKDNWADEFDAEGFCVFENIEDWEDIKNTTRKDMELYFGTNEWFEYSNLEDYLRNVTVQTISDDTANQLKALFGTFCFYPYVFGIFPTPNK